MFNKPILVAPVVSNDGSVKFILPDKEFTLEREVSDDAWAILELCNGLNTVDMIVEALTNIDKQFARGFLADLNSLGVVVDSRRLYETFHVTESNPMIYTSDISNEEIAEHVASERMPVKDGQQFKFETAIDSELVRLQQNRYSCRSFTGESLSVDEIGTVLDIGYSLERHAVPSAGNLYPMKLFLVVLDDQDGLPKGYYEFDNDNSLLVQFNQNPDPQRIYFALNDTELPFGASVVLVIAADVHRQPFKYGNRGYRFTAIEAGHVAQNIALGAVECGLATCELGGIQDEVLTTELDLPDGCLPFIAIALGKSSDENRQLTTELHASYERAFVGEGKPVPRIWRVESEFTDEYDKSYFQFLSLSRDGQTSSGISTSWADASLKAIVEGYERWRSTDWKYDIRCSADSLNRPWLDPRVVAPLTDQQYRDLSNLQEFDEDLVIEWISGVDSYGQQVFVPVDLVFYHVHNMDRKPVVFTSSSGFAAYSDFIEAEKRGLLELIERDSMMRSWYEKTSPDRMVREALPVHLQNRADYWSKRGRRLDVLNISQCGVIGVQVVITSDEYPCFVSGASSSLDSFEDTALKAFYEAESRLIYGLNKPVDRNIGIEEVSTVLDHELLYAKSRANHGHIEYLLEGSPSSDTPVATATISSLKKELGVVTVDVSEDASPIRVVKVLSPELIPINFGFGTNHYSHHSISGLVEESISMPHYFA